MKLIVLAFVFNFILNCWPKTNIAGNIARCGCPLSLFGLMFGPERLHFEESSYSHLQKA